MFIGRKTGPFVMNYRSYGTGVMLSTSDASWAVSFSLFFRLAVVAGWVYRRHVGLYRSVVVPSR